jgi:glycosyltransferase involved in cell wall biosynthesis
MSYPIIDVVVPNYNKVKFIQECLDSLVSQTFLDWRCIVIDGFSDDGSWEVIQSFAAKDSRFEIYQLPRNGLYNSWNFCLAKVTNPYFCILTSDDIWDKNWLQVAISSLENNLNAVCAAARTRIIDVEGNCLEIATHNLMGEQIFLDNLQKPTKINGILSNVANYFLGSIYTSVHSLVMRREILLKGEKFAEDVGAIADYEWYLRMGFYGDIIYHPFIEASHRSYPGQATAKNRLKENGLLMQKIHARNQKLIAETLGDEADYFLALATKYDKEILAYRYARPTGTELKTKTPAIVLELLSVFFKLPKQTIADTYLKIIGKNFYIENSINYAKQIQSKLHLSKA